MRNIALALCAALAIGTVLQPSSLSARPLDTSTCADLDKEKTALETAGVAGDVQLKPDDAKALGADKLQRVQRYVQISADVLFRCPITVVIAPPSPASTAGAKPAALPAGKPDKVATTEPAKAAVAKKPAAPPAKPRAAQGKKSKR